MDVTNARYFSADGRGQAAGQTNILISPGGTISSFTRSSGSQLKTSQFLMEGVVIRNSRKHHKNISNHFISLVFKETGAAL